MSLTTYDLFFTGRDDPRRCIIIGEDVKPVYFCFETPERGLMPCTRTTVIIFHDRLVSSLPGPHAYLILSYSETIRMPVPDWSGAQEITLVVQLLAPDNYRCRTSYCLA
jgi:hypothetical protein